MKVAQMKKDTINTIRGIQKAFKVSVGIVEALAWGGLLAIAYTIIYKTLKGDLSMSDITFAAVVISAVVISLRVLVEGARYFREIGSQSE